LYSCFGVEKLTLNDEIIHLISVCFSVYIDIILLNQLFVLVFCAFYSRALGVDYLMGIGGV